MSPDVKQGPQAEADLRAAIAADANSARAYFWLGVLLHGKGSDDDAIKAFQKCQSLDNGDLGKKAADRISQINVQRSLGGIH
jgi:TolA-binding protein